MGRTLAKEDDLCEESGCIATRGEAIPRTRNKAKRSLNCVLELRR